MTSSVRDFSAGGDGRMDRSASEPSAAARDSQPPLLMFIIDPGAGEILDEYLTDLAGVVARAREGVFTSDRAAKAY
jgi:hypothetical protein